MRLFKKNLNRDRRYENNSGVDNYILLNPAYPYIFGVFFIFVSLISLISLLLDIFFSITLNQNQYIFVLYLSFFASLWIVYFNSRKRNADPNDKQPAGITSFKIKSLRRLLSESSVHWIPFNKESSAALDDLEDSFRKKADTSMKVLAILIAVTVLIMKEVSSVLVNSECLTFEVLMLYMSGFSSLVAFICFVISVDALDIVFNKFRTELDRRIIIYHYYQSTINPRYFGLIGMMLGVIFLASYYSPLAGSLAIGITLFVGYFHWFPEIRPYSEKNKEVTNSWPRVFLWLVMIAPLIIFIINKIGSY